MAPNSRAHSRKAERNSAPDTSKTTARKFSPLYEVVTHSKTRANTLHLTTLLANSCVPEEVFPSLHDDIVPRSCAALNQGALSGSC